MTIDGDNKTETTTLHRTLTRGTWLVRQRRGARAVIALCSAALLAVVLGQADAHACPSRSDPFFVKLVAKGEGATEDAGFMAAFQKLSGRVHVLGDGMQLTPGQRVIVGKTDVDVVPFGEGGERFTVTLVSWYALDASALTMESVSSSCVGPTVLGIINEYDMEKYDQ